MGPLAVLVTACCALPRRGLGRAGAGALLLLMMMMMMMMMMMLKGELLAWRSRNIVMCPRSVALRAAEAHARPRRDRPPRVKKTFTLQSQKTFTLQSRRVSQRFL